MRIAQVCPYSLTVPGGVQAQVMGLARVLRRKGHEVRVLAPCDGPPPEPWVTPLGMSIPTAANGSVAPIAPDPSAALRTIRALRDEQFDIVHLHEPLVPGPTLTALIVADVPRIGTFHLAGASRAYRHLRPAVRRMARRLDLRCAVSEEAAATATAALGGTYDVLFNGIEVERFACAEPVPTTGPTICFIGRHEPRKGLEVLLEAWTGIDRDATLQVVGVGPQTDELQRRAVPGVEWFGTVTDNPRNSLLRGATAFCAPSLRGESFGVVLLEAMAAGAPIVASAIEGYQNVARTGQDALLVPPGDVGALRGALRELIDDPALRARLAASGRERAEQFSMRNLAERYLELYTRALVPAG